MLIKSPADYPLVSVLVPAYNHEKYIVACLDSIMSDGYQNLEVIVLDDGSIDNTYPLAKEWFDLHGQAFSYFDLMHQENRGVARTLNSLLQIFRGKYFVLLASDDMLLEGGIANRLAALERSPKALAVFADAIGIDENGKKLCNSILINKFRASLEALSHGSTRPYELILNWCIPGPVFLAKREVTQKIGYYNENFHVEDRDYYLRLIANDVLTFTATKVAAYRLHSGASTGTRERQIQVGQEVMRIEAQNLARFHGFKRTALWLALKGNATNFRLTGGVRRVVSICHVVIIRSVALVFKYVVRVIAHVQGKCSQ